MDNIKLWEENDHKPRFFGYEIQELVVNDGHCEPATDEDRDRETFWTLYGKLTTGGVEALIDRREYDDILQITYDLGIARESIEIKQ